MKIYLNIMFLIASVTTTSLSIAANNWVATDGPVSTQIAYCAVDSSVLVLLVKYNGYIVQTTSPQITFVLSIDGKLEKSTQIISKPPHYYNPNPAVAFINKESPDCRFYYGQFVSSAITVDPNLPAWVNGNGHFVAFDLSAAFVSSYNQWDNNYGNNYKMSFAKGQISR